MAKKKKTRKQKILADSKKVETLRPQEIPSSSSPNALTPSDLPHTSEYVFRMHQAGKIVKNAPVTLSTTHDFHFLRHDLTKTGILTTSIVLAQLVLYFMLK